MAEEVQISECNGDRHREIPQITNIIDQMDTVMVCETRESDSVIPSDNKEGPGICIEDTIDPLEISKASNEEEHNAEPDTASDQESGIQTSHNTHSEEHNNGEECQTTLEVKCDNVPTYDSPGQEETSKLEKDQEGKTETQDILLMHEQAKPISETGEEDMLTEETEETEDENTSIETDNDNGQGSWDEQENGPGPVFSVSPSGSHLEPNPEQQVLGNISRNSYSRYNTVSYRKIRKGNTKQRIDEFESMMN